MIRLDIDLKNNNNSIFWWSCSAWKRRVLRKDCVWTDSSPGKETRCEAYMRV